MANEYTILLVDDEADILEFLSYNLKKYDYHVYTASNGIEAIEIAQRLKPHLIILDVMMPQMDGIETCEKIREIEDLNQSLIVFLTARAEDYSQIAGFEVGADDYITKPIKPKVLLSKIKALLRRVPDSVNTNVSVLPEQKIEVAPHFVIDTESFVVLKHGKEIHLPKKEFELLLMFVSRIDKVFRREEIFKQVWGSDVVVGDRTIDVHVRKIREKIGNDYIETVKGVGYKFVVPKT